MKYIISIDCGGNKTEIIAVNLQGKIIDRKRFPGISYSYHTNEYFIKKIQDFIERFINGFNSEVTDIEYLILGSSGVYREEEINYISTELSKNYRNVNVFSDVEMGFYAAFPLGCGILLSVGTGSICFGIDKKGRKYRAGGLGYLLGDEGSGFYIGKMGIKAALESFDRGEKGSILHKELLDFFNVNSFEEVVPLIYKSKKHTKLVSGFAPVIINAASKGDAKCSKIINTSIDELVKLIQTVRSMGEFDDPEINVKITGGVVKHNSYFFNKLLEKLSGLKVELVRKPNVAGGINYILKRRCPE
ncbi:BadF/BadG/BcrA/BcrD ATPase family protein [candidate division KSB1 bacterium]